jgi:hypothetical protein
MSLTPDESSAVPPGDSGDAVEDHRAAETPDKPDDAVVGAATTTTTTGDDDAEASDERVLEYLQEAREEENGGGGLPANGSAFRKFKVTDEAHEADVPSPTGGRALSSAGSYSTPDDTPSLHVCICW